MYVCLHKITVDIREWGSQHEQLGCRAGSGKASHRGFCGNFEGSLGFQEVEVRKNIADTRGRQSKETETRDGLPWGRNSKAARHEGG